MNTYTFLFEINNHKFKITVSAPNEYQARLQLKEELNRKIEIRKIIPGEKNTTATPPQQNSEQTVKDIMDIFGMNL
jgi:hypothetical protein